MSVCFFYSGLGDSNYSQFCNCPKSLDKRLKEVGASYFIPPVWGDDAVGLVLLFTTNAYIEVFYWISACGLHRSTYKFTCLLTYLLKVW